MTEVHDPELRDKPLRAVVEKDKPSSVAEKNVLSELGFKPDAAKNVIEFNWTLTKIASVIGFLFGLILFLADMSSDSTIYSDSGVTIKTGFNEEVVSFVGAIFMFISVLGYFLSRRYYNYFVPIHPKDSLQKKLLLVKRK